MAEGPSATDRDAAAFDALDRALRTSGTAAAFDRLIGELTGRGDFRALLDALLLKARHELGLPLIQVGPLVEIPEPARSQFEERYVEAIRDVGARLLAAGDIAAAWPYFRAIAEPGPVAEALDAYRADGGDERVGPVIDIAFNQGANPRRGFELILEHYGTCSAITAFEQMAADEATRAACADALVRQVHKDLVASLRYDITNRGNPEPEEGATIAELIAGRDWLFGDFAYHVDVSHLASVVRMSPLLKEPATIALAVGLTDYGRHLSEKHRYEGEPPFEHIYEDHGIYLGALLGRDVEKAVAHFRSKIGPLDPDRPGPPIEPQVLVGLLVRLGRLEEALDVAAEYLAGYPDAHLICPGVAQLCQRVGRPARLAEVSRRHGDLVNYAAAILQAGPAGDRAGRKRNNSPSRGGWHLPRPFGYPPGMAMSRGIGRRGGEAERCDGGAGSWPPGVWCWPSRPGPTGRRRAS